jgi:uncharacterized iron-regulated protein
MRIGVGAALLTAALCAAIAAAATALAEAELAQTAPATQDENGQDAAATTAAFIEAAQDADIVVLGEIHDNPEHHRTQAAIVAALQPAALVFEMIPQERETEVNDLRAAGANRAALAEALDWAASGWPDFGFYAEILEAAPQARIFGAGQPMADVNRSMLEGAAGVFGPDATIYGLDQQLPPEEQALREAQQAAAHCDMLPPETLPGMVEAQRFRDAGLADATLWARIMTGGEQVVVITGSGHADKRRGMPAMIALAEPEADVVALGQFENPVNAPEEFDAVLLAPAPDREDPCAAFAPPE